MQDFTQPYHPRPPVGESLEATTPAIKTTVPGGEDQAGSKELPGARYRVVEEIARGGMGVVLRAIDLQLNRPLAIKVLLRPDAGGLLARRFLEEARITGQLQHPGVAPVHEVGALADGRPFFSMKLIEGHTLKTLLGQRAAPLDDLPHLLKVFEQVTQTLAYAHAQGVIHRDLKPSNVMVGPFGEVQVMDWGLAKRQQQSEPEAVPPVPADQQPLPTPSTDTASDAELLTRAGQVIGTPAYMPPEQARGEVASLDERSDVFGLGAILCEILTGLPPYSGERMAVVLAAQRGDLAAAESRLVACQADAELIALARRCLSVQPAQRPRDAGVVAAEIAGYLRSVEERLRQAELKHAELQVAAERRRQRLTAALAGTAVALVLLLAGGAFWIQRQSRQNELLRQEAETQRIVEVALAKAERSAAQASELPQRDSAGAATAAAVWREAQASVEQARAALQSGASGAWDTALLERMHRQVTQGLAQAEQAQQQFVREEKFLRDLDAARLARSTWVGNRFDVAGGARQYEQAFAEFGLAIPADAWADTREFTGQLKSLAPQLLEAIVVALDDWAVFADSAEDSRSAADLQRLAEIHDDLAWRKRLRSAAEKKDVAELMRLAAEASKADVPASTLDFLADHLRARGQKAAGLDVLRAACDAHPDDFWTHYSLAWALEDDSTPGAREEQIGAYRAALAVRPDAAAAYNNLGNIYFDANRVAEAELCFERAIAADPEFAVGYSNLARIWESRDLERCISLYRTALAKYPGAGTTHNNLAAIYSRLGDQELAMQHYRRAIECEPSLFLAHQNLGIALLHRGEMEVGRLHLCKAAALQPKTAGPQFALALLYLNRGELSEAARRVRLALAASPQDLDYLELLSDVQCSSGDFTGAVASLQQALARAAKAAEPPTDKWRRDVEAALAERQRYATLAANLPEFLAGTRPVPSGGEHVDLAVVCGYRRHFAAAARQYARAFALDPALAESLKPEHAYHAASAAALALVGRSEGEPALTAAEAQELRGWAFAWLQAELQTHRVASPPVEDGVASLFQHRLTDSTFRALRDSELLAALPAQEQQDWQTYWTAVEKLSAGPVEPPTSDDDPFFILLPRPVQWFPLPLPPAEIPPVKLQAEANSLGMRMVRIPVGTFIMGTAPTDGDLADEIPHEVRIERPFWMSAHEVTVAQFREFATSTGLGLQPISDRRNTWGVDEQGYFLANREFTWTNPGFAQGDEHPVCCVSWTEAAAFCRWLSEKEQCTYRLPTEAEWEYACRAGTRYRFFDEQGIKNVTTFGNVSDEGARKRFPHWPRIAPGDDGHLFTAPVGSFAPNRFGLYDMVGNVTEFCGDWHDVNACLLFPAIDPQGPPTGTRRVARGDAFHDRTRISNRFLLRPNRRQNNVGFRIVREEEVAP
jgi:formylglycine-generating enzyme required for sulfatase activity/serine/threonine protein kinase/Tfp pilus assembly protein PilF